MANLFRNHLFYTNLGVSMSLSCFGDVVQQKYEHRQKSLLRKDISASDVRWNKKRTYNMGLSFGLTSGFMCHFWYKYLDRILPGKGIKVVMKKIISDQILFSPICIGSCLSVAAIVNGLDKERSYKDIMSKGTKLYIAEWVIWPPAQFVNFYFLPTRYRVLYDNTISLLYDTYTSHVQNEPCCDDDE